MAIMEEREEVEAEVAAAPEAPKLEPEKETISSRDKGAGDNDDDAHAKAQKKKYGWITKLRNFLKTHRMELALWIARIVTCFYCVFAMFPVIGPSSFLARRALIANGFASGMRLYQRRPEWNREFYGKLIMEDSCHYLLYSLMFLYLGHISFALIPIFFIASLHVASFTYLMLEAVHGPAAANTSLGACCVKWRSRSSTFLRLAASAEVFLMGMIILNCFKGTLSVFTPFVYYRFITLRYISKRNHFTRLVFYEMRMMMEKCMTSRWCPPGIARLVRGVMMIICKLSPM